MYHGIICLSTVCLSHRVLDRFRNGTGQPQHSGSLGHKKMQESPLASVLDAVHEDVHASGPVSYTHLTLPTIYSV